jgi:NAD(P)-dependent dehydrogenase (short-subunit alcohol dehydrogenase family)
MSSRVLDGRRVVVTGAGIGLGAAYAEAAAAAGAAVLANDIDAGLAAATAERITANGGRAVPFAADVAEWDGARAIIEHCVSELGGIDGLVNNAGILGLVRPIHEEQASARRTIDVNVTGTLYVAAHAARAMVSAGTRGAIVNVSSGAQCGLHLQGTYSASKGAVASYTYSWARDLDEHNIRVNAMAPNAYTNQHDELIEQLGYNPEKHHTAYASREDNAAVVIYLLSNASEKVNGQVVRVQHDALTLMSHPLIIQPYAPVSEWSVESVAEAFDNGLADQLQPVGVAAAGVLPEAVIF